MSVLKQKKWMKYTKWLKGVNMSKEKRELGYYWVVYKGVTYVAELIVGRYGRAYWYFTGSDMSYKESELDEINEKIERS